MWGLPETPAQVSESLSWPLLGVYLLTESPPKSSENLERDRKCHRKGVGGGGGGPRDLLPRSHLSRKHHPLRLHPYLLLLLALGSQQCGAARTDVEPRLQTAGLLPSKAPAHPQKMRPSVVKETTSTPATQSQVLPGSQPGICFPLLVSTEETCEGL